MCFCLILFFHLFLLTCANPFTSLTPCNIISNTVIGRTGNQIYGLVIAAKLAMIFESSLIIKNLERFQNLFLWKTSFLKDEAIYIPRLPSHYSHHHSNNNKNHSHNNHSSQSSSVHCSGDYAINVWLGQNPLITSDIIDIYTMKDKLKDYFTVIPKEVSSLLSSTEKYATGDETKGKVENKTHSEGRYDHMAIHFRAGDIFKGNVMTVYHQAPCNYLKKVIEDLQPTTITILTEVLFGSAAHPCVEKVIEWYSRSKEINLHQGSMEAAFLILAHAQVIVFTGLSSFTFYAAAFNSKKKIIVTPVFHPIPRYEEEKRFFNYSYFSKDFYSYLPPSLPDGTKVIRYSIEGFPQGPWSESLFPQLTNDSLVVMPFKDTFPSPVGNFLDSVSFTYILGEGVCDDLPSVVRRTLEFLRVAYLFPPFQQTSFVISPSFSVIVLTCRAPEETRQFYHNYDFTEARKLIPSFQPYLIRFYHINEKNYEKPYCKRDCSLFYSSEEGNYDRLKDQVVPTIRQYEPFSSIFYVWIKHGKGNLEILLHNMMQSMQDFQFHQHENNSITTNLFEIFGGKKLILFQKLYGIIPKTHREKLFFEA